MWWHPFDIAYQINIFENQKEFINGNFEIFMLPYILKATMLQLACVENMDFVLPWYSLSWGEDNLRANPFHGSSCMELQERKSLSLYSVSSETETYFCSLIYKWYLKMAPIIWHKHETKHWFHCFENLWIKSYSEMPNWNQPGQDSHGRKNQKEIRPMTRRGAAEEGQQSQTGTCSPDSKQNEYFGWHRES